MMNCTGCELYLKKLVFFKKKERKGKGAVEMEQEGCDQKQIPGTVGPGCPPSQSPQVTHRQCYGSP